MSFGVLSIAAAMVCSIPDSMQNFARLQPMRSLHLVYVIFFLFLGALGEQYLFKRRIWLDARALRSPLRRDVVGCTQYLSGPARMWSGPA